MSCSAVALWAAVLSCISELQLSSAAVSLLCCIAKLKGCVALLSSSTALLSKGIAANLVLLSSSSCSVADG